MKSEAGTDELIATGSDPVDFGLVKSLNKRAAISRA
jgi:hypothetical protein